MNSEENCYVLDRYNAFIRRLIYQEVRLRWPEVIRLEGKNENGNQYLVAYKTGTREEEDQKAAERREKEKQDVQQAVGLSALLRKISESVSFFFFFSYQSKLYFNKNFENSHQCFVDFSG